MRKLFALLALLLTPSATSAQTVSAAVNVTPILDTEIVANQGFSDVSPHQIVRTSAGTLYIATPSCAGDYPDCPGTNFITMQKGNNTGTPTSFSEQDSADRPTASSSTDMIGSTAIAVDGSDNIWVAYNTKLVGTYVVKYTTSNDQWGTPVRIGTALSAHDQYDVSQGREGVALAVNSSGLPTIVFSYDGGATNVKYLGISTYSGASWSTPVRIDDQTLGTGQGALHPAIAFTANNRLVVTWLMGDECATYNASANVYSKCAPYNNNDGIIYVRVITDLTPSSTSEAGTASVEIPDTANSHGNAGFAATVIDNGPSILLTPDGVAHITYIDSYEDEVRYWYSNVNVYTTWHGDEQPTVGGNPQETHDPSLGPDGNGGIYIYGHGTPASNRDGHGNNMYRFHKASGATTWSTFQEIVSDNNIDCSVSTRWSQFFFNFPTRVDWLYWNDNNPNTSRVSVN